MKIKEKQGRASGGALARGQAGSRGRARTAQFLRRTFYYLKGEQFLKASNQLLCETV